MQFIADGPDIPDELLQAHEEGRVVFFCGAGISYPAGLPGFKELVDKIYKLNSDQPDALEFEAYDKDQFDITLDLLERRLVGQRSDVRNALAKVLLKPKDVLDTHKALLQLACTRNDALRIVTTNFDRLFDCAAKEMKLKHHVYTAPMLPVPKDSRWNGVVYLHGQLPSKPKSDDLDQLVITSGDFGLAYRPPSSEVQHYSILSRHQIL